MRVNYVPIVAPVVYMFLLFVVQILFNVFIGSSGYGEIFTLVSLPSDFALFSVTVFAILIVRVLPPDLRERRYWISVLVALSLYSIGVILRMYILPLFPNTQMAISYVQFIYVCSIIIFSLAMIRLIVDLGVPVIKKTRNILIILAFLLSVVLLGVFLPQIIFGNYEIVVVLTSSVVAILCALIVPIAIMLYLSIRRGVLRIPYLFNVLAVPMIALQSLSLVFMNLHGITDSTLRYYFLVPFMLFCTFALIALSTRIHIAGKLSKDIDGSYLLEPTKH